MQPLPPGGWLAAAGALAAGTAAAGLYSWRRQYHRTVSKPELTVGDGDLRRLVLPHCGHLLTEYHPTPYALSTHLQTVLGLLRRASIGGEYHRVPLMASDGGTTALDWFGGCNAASYAPADTPVLLVLHGINGGSHEGYAKWACAAACGKGWRAVVLNYRGCNGLQLTSPRGYAATATEDVARAVQSIRAQFPSAPVLAVGYSLGGILLTKYVADADAGLVHHPWGEGSGLAAAAFVSNPVCLFNSSSNLSRPWSFNFVYNLAVGHKLKEYVSAHREALRGRTNIDIDAVLRSWTVQAIEEVGIPRTFGYNSRAEYYEDSSSLKYIPQIKTPSLILLSRDDPFVGTIPDAECRANPHTLLAVTAHGGHVAFLQGWWPFKLSWMDNAVMEFLEQVLARHPQRPALLAATTTPEQPPALPLGRAAQEQPAPPPPRPETLVPHSPAALFGDYSASVAETVVPPTAVAMMSKL